MTVAEETAAPILEFGRAWMQAPGTRERADVLGFTDPFGLWATGRAGAMGDVTKEAAAAAIGFMAPARLAQIWDQRPNGIPPQHCAAEYAGAAAAFGREVLANVGSSRLQRLTELSMKVANAAPASTGVLFSAWRAMELPSDQGGAATIALQILRELRGGAHISAVHAVGLGPHVAIMSVDHPVRGGIPGAERFGWEAPHPEGDVVRRAEAEVLTGRACEPAYAALNEAEGAEFTELVLEARALVD